MGTRTRSRVTWDIWSKPRALGPGPKLPGTAVHPRRPSDPGPNRPGQLVEREDTRTRSRSAREIWSTPRSLGPGPIYPRTAGRAHGNLGTGPSYPGQLVEAEGPPTRAQVARESWLMPWAQESGTRSPGTAGRHHGPLHQITLCHVITRALVQVSIVSTSCPRQLGPGSDGPPCRPAVPGDSGKGPKARAVDQLSQATRARVPGSAGSTRCPGRTRARMARRVGRPHRPSDPGPCCPGHLVEPAEPGTGAQVAHESWSPPRAFRHIPESPGTAGRHRRP